ncbi:DNA repair protein RecN [uncultured Maricaulis sp.]|uniref:DNA repair protein RecN n=1 Tax=uncultured Maricaulis sp. TaxID=174710 RepID=UPI002625747B|nr:DNA repair protein RecN [uncultured Maricaulis sp.]
MLLSLSIRNVVLIDALDAAFDGGLCALTGETGAGKSILLGALGLAAGERADRAQVRSGADEAQAIAEFDLPTGHPAWQVIEEAGLTVEPGEPLILRRRLGEDGRSRAHVNDQPASIGLLRGLGDVLVEVHGQHDGRGLMDPRTHRTYLDSFAGHAALVASCRTAWRGLSEAQRKLDELVTANQASDSEQDFLRHAIEELDRLDPRPGEEAELAEERQFLQGAERALGDLQEAQQALAGEGGGLESRLNAALRGLERVRDHIGTGGGNAGAALERASTAIDRALIEFAEAEDALGDAAQAFDVEPGRLNEVEERLFALRGLARKHHVAPDDLAELHGQLTLQLDGIENATDRIAEAESAVKAARARYDDAAHALSRSREKAGKALSSAVASELPPLKMDKARFRVAINSDDDKAGPDGRDHVVFEVATNPGSPFGALDKIASGGELSRFGLALKVALAGEDDGLVLVFDEVDQGVGGAVADAVGRRLKRLAAKGQTLVVTHSPQVAALADHHWQIVKSDDGKGGVRTTLIKLEGEARREEIARMLSGADITDAARAQADALMAVEA